MEDIQNYHQAQEQYQSIKPVIKTSLLLVKSFLHTLVIYLVLGWFLTSPLLFIFGLFGAEGIIAGVLSILVLFFAILFIVFLLKKAALRKIEYKFYNNRIEYYDGFLVKNRKTINYDRITNIGQRKGILEGWFGLGTIFIDTAGSSAKGHELSMSFLENSDRLYDWMTKITAKRQ